MSTPPNSTSKMSLPSIQTHFTSLNPSLNVFISHLSDSAHRLLSKQRPWSEVISHSSFSRPHSFSEAASRIYYNTSHFRINYAQLLGAVLVFSLLSHPTSLLCIVLLCFAWVVLYLFRPPERNLVILGRSFSRNEILGLLVGATVIVLLFTSVGSLLVHAFLVGMLAVCAHGAFRCPEDMFHDDQAAPYSSRGIFSNGIKRSPGLGGGDTLVSCV